MQGDDCQLTSSEVYGLGLAEFLKMHASTASAKLSIPTAVSSLQIPFLGLTCTITEVAIQSLQLLMFLSQCR